MPSSWAQSCRALSCCHAFLEVSRYSKPWGGTDVSRDGRPSFSPATPLCLPPSSPGPCPGAPRGPSPAEHRHCHPPALPQEPFPHRHLPVPAWLLALPPAGPVPLPALASQQGTDPPRSIPEGPSSAPRVLTETMSAKAQEVPSAWRTADISWPRASSHDVCRG